MKILKIIIILLMFLSLNSCGFSKLNDETKNISFGIINIDGNKRITYELKNKINLIAKEIALSILKEKLSARSVENLVKNQKESEGNKVKLKSKVDSNVLLIQRQIEENLGLNTKVISRKNNSGKIIIEFNNLDQFEMLSKLLKK